MTMAKTMVTITATEVVGRVTVPMGLYSSSSIIPSCCPQAQTNPYPKLCHLFLPMALK